MTSVAHVAGVSPSFCGESHEGPILIHSLWGPSLAQGELWLEATASSLQNCSNSVWYVVIMYLVSTCYLNRTLGFSEYWEKALSGWDTVGQLAYSV